jgi:hypothetical protein
MTLSMPAGDATDGPGKSRDISTKKKVNAALPAKPARQNLQAG